MFQSQGSNATPAEGPHISYGLFKTKLILDGLKKNNKTAKQESGSNIINLITDFFLKICVLVNVQIKNFKYN